MKKKLHIGLLVLFIGTGKAIAQPSLQKMQARLSLVTEKQYSNAKMTIENPTQAAVLFTDNAGAPLKQADAAVWLGAQLDLRQGIDELTLEAGITQAGDLTVQKLHQYYKGIKVEHGTVSTTARNGNIAMMQLEFYSIAGQLETNPAITEQQAFQKAIQFTSAKKYVWENYTGNNPDFEKPKGELVIVRTYKNDSSVCLAWKFNIYASVPLSRTLIYVNAWDGTIVLDDAIIKHANTPGTADTKYSGVQNIITDNASGASGKPYRLRHSSNGHNITVLDYHTNPDDPVSNDQLATDFLDNDNNWTDAEHNNYNMDNAATDALFNATIVSDYWKFEHGRNSWDDKNGEQLIYVHVNEVREIPKNSGMYYSVPMDNAYWNGSNLHLGDGAPQNVGGNPPATSLDDIAHETGHGITTATSNLVYRWESGAINEGFSDVWAACITRYAKQNYSSLSSERIWRLFEKSSKPNATEAGLRDMQDPHIFDHPKGIKSMFWQPATYQTCPVTDGTIANDHCGVHNNSSVFNYWFYLVTDGGTGTNPSGSIYFVTGMGFLASQKLAYLTSLNLPPNATFATTKTVTINAATTLFGANGFEVQSVKDAWAAVGVDTSIWNMSNTPVFTANNFTSIAVGTGGHVWAGTNYAGLYEYDGVAWTKRPQINNVRINDIKTDRAGGIWVAQSGTQGGSAAIAGGVNYFPTSASAGNFYTVSTQVNVPSRNARCIYVDTSLLNDGTNPKVWVATLSYILNGNSTSGMLGQGLYNNSRFFRAVSEGLNIASNTAGVLTVGGNKKQVWTFAQANNGVNQLMVYDAVSHVLITTYDHISVPIIPSGFVARAIFFDAKGRCWVGMANNGVMVYDEQQKWHHINFSEIFPAGSQVNFNAITGDKYGDVYIGTSAGLVFFDHGIGHNDRLDSSKFYKLYTKGNGLPSANVNAIAYDTLRFRIWMATDSGVVRWEPLCLGKSCDLPRNSRNAESASLGPGNWSNPAIWSSGEVPDSNTNVTITDTIMVDVTAHCHSISVVPPGRVQVAAGVNLTIHEGRNNVIYGRQRSVVKPRN